MAKGAAGGYSVFSTPFSVYEVGWLATIMS